MCTLSVHLLVRVVLFACFGFAICNSFSKIQDTPNDPIKNLPVSFGKEAEEGEAITDAR